MRAPIGDRPAPQPVAARVTGWLARQARSRRNVVAAIVGGVIGGAALVGAGPLARSVARSRAEALGITLQVREARIGWGVVRLEDVSLAIEEAPTLHATFDHVEVFPSFRLSVRGVAIHGGHVELDGSLAAIERQLSAWRASRASGTGRGTERALAVAADGVDVIWKNALGAQQHERIWGAWYQRGEDGRETLGADLVRLAAPGGRVEIADGRVELTRREGRRAVAGLSAARTVAALDLDALPGPLGAAAGVIRGVPTNPMVATSASPGLVARGTGGAPSSRVQAASDGAALGPALRERIVNAARSVGDMLPAPAKIALEGARFEVRHAGETLNVGPASVSLQREKDRVRVGIVSGAREASAPLRLVVDAPLGAGAVDVVLEGGPVSLAGLGVKEHDMGLQDVNRAEIDVSVKARVSADGKTLSLSGRSRLSDLSLFQEKLAPDPVQGLRLAFAGDADVQLDGSLVTLKDVEVGVGKVRLRTQGELVRAEGHARGKLHAEVPLAACSDMLASIPAALVPLLAGLEVTGTFAFSGDLAFDTRRPGDTALDWNVASDCRIRRVPTALSPERFRQAWVRTVQGADGVPTTIESGPGTPTWVPFTEISPHLPTAIVVCEDSRFFTHDGFDAKSIRDSLRDNLRAGRFVRGASTVTMQLAKNLYLGREKTLSRKLQEAVLTLLLEQQLGKEQILELYLNVIEFAPGVYGIGPAAEHYFRTTPRELSLAQSLYLATVLPNPRIQHFDASGALSERWTAYLQKLMTIAHKIRRITDAELEAGLAETVRFGLPASGDAARLDTMDPAMEGSAGPEVLDLAPRGIEEEPAGDAQGP